MGAQSWLFVLPKNIGQNGTPQKTGAIVVVPQSQLGSNVSLAGPNLYRQSGIVGEKRMRKNGRYQRVIFQEMEFRDLQPAFAAEHRAPSRLNLDRWQHSRAT